MTSIFKDVILLRHQSVGASYNVNNGCLAQLVEHRPYKARVVGSSPSASTIFLKKNKLILKHGRVAKWPNAVDCKSIPNGFGGSNPSSSTISLGYSQAVRHQTLTLTFPWFESTYPSHYGSLAQSVEHVTFNHGVASSNLVRITILCPDGGTGRRTGLKILWVERPVPVRFWFRAPFYV